jgi:hypothetical protein
MDEKIEPNYYLLRVNLNGFNKNDVKVTLFKETLLNKIEITAINKENNGKNGSLINEYNKIFELPKNSCYNLDTMETCFDDDNKHLVIKFKSNKPETHLINMLNNSNDDDIYVNLIEKTAKNLQNLKNLDDIKEAIENVLNESSFNFNSQQSAEDCKLNNDLHLLSKHNNLPSMYIINNGMKILRVCIKIPQSIDKVVDLSNVENKILNHLYIKSDKFTVFLDAETKFDETTSKFTKQFNLPIGTDYEKMVFCIDDVNNSLIIEAPFRD